MSNPAIIDGLNGNLADAVVMFYKLHNYHWFVSGSDFFDLHERFEQLYNRWAEVMDEVAERVLTIGGEPVGTLAGALELARLTEETRRPSALQMVRHVITDLNSQHERMGATIEAAEEAGDRGTVNLLDGIRDDIEKTAWMLEAWTQQVP